MPEKRTCLRCKLAFEAELMPVTFGLGQMWDLSPRICPKCVNRQAADRARAAYDQARAAAEFPPTRFAQATVHRDHPVMPLQPLADVLKAGGSIWLAGAPGRGKTVLAVQVALTVLAGKRPTDTDDERERIRVWFAHESRIMQAWDAREEAALARVRSIRVLVYDDLGTQGRPALAETVINGRYEAGLPTLVTTNYSAAQLEALPDYQRSASRLREMCGRHVYWLDAGTWADLRGASTAAEGGVTP